MVTPTFREERKLYGQGYKMIAGVDEAGRGSLAGPMVAAAVILEPKLKIKGVRDSKMLLPKQREEAFVQIVRNSIAWGVGVVESEDIDSMGLTRANSFVLKKAILKLGCRPDHMLIDYFSLHDMDIPSNSYVRGDQTIYSIAAASIIAKVIRDEIMRQYDRLYPQYKFAEHKGYGTKKHIDIIREHGLTDIHRKSFDIKI